MENSFSLMKHGGSSQLWTRELARSIRDKAEAELAALAPGDALVIDLDGVEVFDFSFANEFFGKLLLRLPDEYPGRFVIVEHLTSYTRENLVRALEGLSLVIIERVSGKLSLLGKVHPVDKDTFLAVVRKKVSVTAKELQDQLEVNLTTVNERLSKLVALGLLRREKAMSRAGREQYTYTVMR
jgi:hypothetical protein